jgi:hypothetical protein
MKCREELGVSRTGSVPILIPVLGVSFKEAGVSRSVLTERFRHYLNEPPMAYLTR